MKKIYFIITLCLFFLVGCSGAKKNYEINISLEGNNETGYIWEYQGNKDETFELKKEDHISNENNIETYSYKLVPLKEGTTSIAFKYTNNNEVLYLVKYDLEVDKKLNVKVLNVETNSNVIKQNIIINEIK